MKKIKKLIAMVAVVMAVFSVSIPVSAAGCGNWYVEKMGKPYCKAMSCGPGLALPAYRQTVHWKRKCVSNSNKTTYPTKTSTKGLGCC